MNICISVLSFFLGPVYFFLDSALLYSNLKDVEKRLVFIVISLPEIKDKMAVARAH